MLSSGCACNSGADSLSVGVACFQKKVLNQNVHDDMRLALSKACPGWVSSSYIANCSSNSASLSLPLCCKAGADAQPAACLMAWQHVLTATDPARPPRTAAQLIQDSSSGIKGSSWPKADAVMASCWLLCVAAGCPELLLVQLGLQCVCCLFWLCDSRGESKMACCSCKTGSSN